LTHLTGELLQHQAGIKLLLVPYTGGPAHAFSDVASGRVALIIEGYSGIAGAVRSGSVKLIAVASTKRLAEFPDVPTVAETIPGFRATGWGVLVRDTFGLPAPRMTYDWRRPNEVARVEFVHRKLEELGRSMGATHVWRAPPSPGSPISHHQGGTRMGSDPTTSMVNRYGQSWDIPNLFIVGSSTFPTSAGFNPTLTIQALAYMTADAIVTRYKKNPGPLL
jgi:choline dehydrogenase-like flavoprotein